MCSLCGVLGYGPSWEQEGLTGTEARWKLRREATATALDVTRLLSCSRVKVTASSEFGFVVSFPTGGAQLVSSLSQVWHLLARRKIEIPDPIHGTSPRLRRVLIETSGVSDPLPILQTLRSELNLLARFQIGSIVCAVDASAGAAITRVESVRQITAADGIVITKRDLAVC